MNQQRTHVDRRILRTLAPIDALSLDNFEELWRKTYLETLPAGAVLFKQGDNDNYRVYLVSGELTVTAPDGQRKDINGKDPICRHPLANHKPRRLNAVAKTNITFVRIDNDLLDILLTWDQSASYVVADLQDQSDAMQSTDWMTRILRSNIFYRIPPANIQAVFMRLSEMPVKAGQQVIKQDDVPDYFYVIQRGRCEVRRYDSNSDQTIILAKLGPGDGFGEEALLAETKRNASVIMETDGIVMTLSRDDFNALLKSPVISRVNMARAESLRKEEGAMFIDVRLGGEIHNDMLDGSIHIPFSNLRTKAPNLDPARPYIIYCDTGRRSSAAAYLLNSRGIEAYVMDGGLNKQRAQRAA